MSAKPTLSSPPVHRQPSQAEIDSTASMLAQTMALVRLQMKRIRKDIAFHVEVTASGKQDEVSESCTSLFADVHYLLISLHNVEQLFSRLKRLTPYETELTDVRNRHRKWLRQCSEFRCLMDQTDTRGPLHPIDKGRLDGDSYCINGLRFDVGPGRERDVEKLLKDLESAWSTVSDRQKKLRDLISKRIELAS